MAAISPEVYKDQLRSQLRRVWGAAFARENARLKLARLEHVTGVCTATGAVCQRPRRTVRARAAMRSGASTPAAAPVPTSAVSGTAATAAARQFLVLPTLRLPLANPGND